MTDTTKLAEAMEFDHIIEVLPDGTFRDPEAQGLPYAPEAIDPDNNAVELDGWRLPLSGMTGQHGYSGPWLHNSELIAGGVAEKILTMPGYWVAIYARYECEECSGAGVLWNEDMTEELDCPNIALGTCEPGGILEGWTCAYLPTFDATATMLTATEARGHELRKGHKLTGYYLTKDGISTLVRTCPCGNAESE